MVFWKWKPLITSTSLGSLLPEFELVVLIFRTAMIFLAIVVSLTTPIEPDSLQLLRLSIIPAALYNVIVLALFMRNALPSIRHFLQLLLDVVMITFWVYFSWNAGPLMPGTPLVHLYYVVIIAGAFWYGSAGALLTAVGSSALLLIFLFLKTNEIFVLVDSLYSPIVYLFLVAVFAAYLMDLTARERKRLRRQAETELSLAKYEEEFKRAEALYNILIPDLPPVISSYQIGKRFQPAIFGTGGDFFDFYLTKTGTLLITLADVSGKARQASLVLPFYKSVFQAAVRMYEDPGEILSQVNKIIYSYIDEYKDMFITASVVSLSADGIVNYANAGSDPLIVLNEQAMTGAESHLSDNTGGNLSSPIFLSNGQVPLGIDDITNYTTDTFTLSQHDTLCLYTDGITEARSPAGDEFGIQRMLTTVQHDIDEQKTADEIADAVFTATRDFAETVPQRDDMTLLIIRYLPESMTMQTGE